MESFSHYDIIDEHGNRIAEGHKASFCLEDTSCQRGIFPKYECKGFGHQGMYRIASVNNSSTNSDPPCIIDCNPVEPMGSLIKINITTTLKQILGL